MSSTPHRRAYALLLAAFTASFAAAVPACSGGSDATTSGADAGTGGSTLDDAGADAQPDAAADAGPQKPPECEEITLPKPLTSTQQATPEAYQFQPDLNGTPVVGGTTGDPKEKNIFLFFVDAADTVGSYPIGAFTTYIYASGNTGAFNADHVTPDASTSPSWTRYAASSGTVEVTSVLTPYQTEGHLSGVRFDEVTLESDGSAKLVPGGKCQWLADATWNTKRAGGCVPFAANTCPTGQFCMPTNAIGDDGICAASTGTKAVGEVCVPASTGTWDSDCAEGLRCAQFAVDLGETMYTCHQLCDVRSDSPVCPATAHCGGGYNVCLSIDFLLNSGKNGNEIDTVALVGQDCVQNPTAIYCGGAGRPGTCVKDTGATTAQCRPLQEAASVCTADGKRGGYLAYKAATDSSTIFCIK